MHTQRPSLGQWLADAPFTLSMSSGFFGFFAHAGVLQALRDNALEPARYTGSSAGALVAGLAAAGCLPQTMKARLHTLDRDHFWDPGPGLGVLKGQAFRQLLASLLPVTNFGSCPRPVAISVWQAASGRTQVLEHGDLVEAIYSSCAVPVLFQPGRIDGKLCWDGGIRDRHGLAGTHSGERILYHHLASRSPWRRKSSASLQVPSRRHMVSLVLEGLPRSGPSSLEQGRLAFQMAYQGTIEALNRPVKDGQVRLEMTPASNAQEASP
ncbi:patatin [Alcanivorax hongdengensis A-11-3]|uniref:Patatin n=1 Tax=Alcanivorax hongdengensis A-11-3 TaxID=1177179 RepID=L0WE50_9GAMM|nr:patatin-like phospholipase family protein [Alcanivorax hongdengensis]EKF74085.1 patatin [Alcanivorax hongdengensis A-11-3]